MSTAPNCKKNAERARLRRPAHLEEDREASSWKHTLRAGDIRARMMKLREEMKK